MTALPILCPWPPRRDLRADLVAAGVPYLDADLVERMRMALAEAGYPNALIIGHPHGGSGRFDPAIPDAVVWRAREVVGFRSPLCLACFVWLADEEPPPERYDELRGRCAAPARFTPDCGVSR